MRDPGSIRLHQSMFGSGSLPAILQEVRRGHCLVVTMNPQRRSQCRTSRHSIHPNGLVRGFLEQADEAEAAHPPPPLRSTADQTPFAPVRRGTTAPFGFVTQSAKSASSPRNNASGVADLSMRQAWRQSCFLWTECANKSMLERRFHAIIALLAGTILRLPVPFRRCAITANSNVAPTKERS